MPKYSQDSKKKLSTCHVDLQRIFNEVIKHYDCTILEGVRIDAKQVKLFREGKSKLDGIIDKSKHQVDKNNPLSRAVDVCPYPIPDGWGNDNPKERSKFYYFAGAVLGIAQTMGINIRWGGDWDSDGDFKDQTFDDLVHFELCEPKKNL